MPWPAVVGRPFADVPMSLWDQIVGPSLFELSRANQVYDDAGHRQALRRAMPWVENEGLAGPLFGGIPWRTRLGTQPRDAPAIVEPWRAPALAPTPAQPDRAEPATHGHSKAEAEIIKEFLDLEPHEFRGRVFGSSNEGGVGINGNIVKNGHSVGSISHSFDGRGHNGYLGLLSLSSNQQGAGLGKKILKANIDYYRKHGGKALKLNANIDVGSYAWARYGFVPRSTAEWVGMIPSLRARAQEMNLPPKIMDAVRAATRSANPESIWKIADMQYRLPPTKGYPQGRTLGQALLMNRSWNGVLDLTNPRANERFDAYVGK